MSGESVMCRLAIYAGAISILGVLAFGCDASDPCSQIESSLRSCGLLTEGEYSCSGFAGESGDTVLECTASCMDSANCAQRKAHVCLGGFDWSGGSSGLSLTVTGCINRCINPTIVCDDGEVVEGARCDWDTDCGDGSDELGCAEFACESGYQWVSEDARCDGYSDCDDGSDESSETCRYSSDQLDSAESAGPESCTTSEGFFGMTDCLGFCRYEALDDWGDGVCDPWLDCAEWSYDLYDCDSGDSESDVEVPAADAMVVCGSD